jgi:hypothetical protein|tara:strand:- start:90 stop:539 length:450 start_codon:yes stop_codon:yes gene_type:complete
MALVINDRVKETSTTTGTGNFTLLGASQDFESFSSGVGAGNTTYYTLVNINSNEWEVGLGTLSNATTLQRTTPISSSSNDAAVSFGAGTKDVFCTIPAKKTISPIMDPTTYVVTHNSTISEDQTMDSGVLAGPVTITANLTVTGNLFIA